MIEYNCPKCGNELSSISIGYICGKCKSYYDKELVEEEKKWDKITDYGKLEAVIELAEKEFNITNEKQKEKLKILFNAYVNAYMSICCTL